MHLNVTLLGQMITFAIFVWFTMRIIWPLLTTQMEARQKRIADGLAAAEEGHKTLLAAEAQAKHKIHEAKLHCYKILEDAAQESARIIEAAKAQAKIEYDNTIAAGNAQLSRQVRHAKSDLQVHVANLVIKGAEKILQRSINPDDHVDILNSLAKEL